MNTLYAVLIGAAYSALYYVRSGSTLDAVWLALGWLIGAGLLELDEQVGYRWYNEAGQHHLLTRSPLFWLAYVPLAIFVLTSSGSLIGTGMVMGIGSVLWVEMIAYARQPEQFAQRFLSRVAKPVSAAEMQKILGAATICFLILTIMVFR